MSIADMVEQMMDRGVDRDLILLAIRTAEASHSGGNPVEARLQKIRAYDRNRKRLSSGIPAEFQRNDETALTLKEVNKKEKKVRATKHPLPAEWKPNEKHFAAAEEMKIPEAAVLSKAEDLRIWAGSTGALKADWDLTFHGFLRRDAPKLAVSTPKTAVTITPESQSWNRWKSHYRDTGKNFAAAHMDKCASDGKPFTVPSEFPPGVRAA
jgi:hypothetical protein